MNELTLFNPVKAELSMVIPNLKAIQRIADEPGALVAQLGLKQLSSMLSAAESIRKSTKQPHIDAGKMIDEHFKILTHDAVVVQAHLKRVLLDWNGELTKRKAEEQARLVAEKAANDERIKLEQARNVTPAALPDDVLGFDDELPVADQKRKEIIVAANLEVEQFVADKTHESAMKATEKLKVKGVRKVWKYVVDDITKVPRAYLELDDFKVRQFLNANRDLIGTENGPSIDGLKFVQEEIMAAR